MGSLSSLSPAAHTPPSSALQVTQPPHPSGSQTRRLFSDHPLSSVRASTVLHVRSEGKQEAPQKDKSADYIQHDSLGSVQAGDRQEKHKDC